MPPPPSVDPALRIVVCRCTGRGARRRAKGVDVVIVVGIIEVEAGDRDRYLASKRDQVATTLAEVGCLDYSFAADAGDPARVRLLERWESMADLNAHVAALRSSDVPAGPTVPSRMAEITLYEADPAPAPWG